MQRDQPVYEWACRVRIELGRPIRRLIAQAIIDLYHGPLSTDDDYPGFVSACEQISKAVDQYVFNACVDTDEGVIQLPPATARRALLGVLAEYI